MRLTTVQRSAGHALALAAVLVLAGCDSRTKGTAAGTAGAPTAAPPTAGGPASAAQTPRQAAEAVLAALSRGEAKPDHLTAAFLDQVPRPVTTGPRTAESDRAAARDFLAQFRDTKFVLGEAETKFGNAVAFRGRAEAPNRREAFTLRLIRDGEEYKIDWLHRSERIGTEIKPAAEPDLAAAQETVRNFLDVLLGGDLRQAHALMAPVWKKRIAPPTPADVRRGDDYDPGFLTQTTRFWKGDFTGYSLPKAGLSPDKAAATFTAEFQAGGQTVPYTVQAVKGPAGRWMVRDFSKQ